MSEVESVKALLFILFCIVGSVAVVIAGLAMKQPVASAIVVSTWVVAFIFEPTPKLPRTPHE